MLHKLKGHEPGWAVQTVEKGVVVAVDYIEEWSEHEAERGAREPEGDRLNQS